MQTRVLCLISSILLLYGCAIIHKQGEPMESYDCLIQGGTVIDGTGSPGVQADVLIDDGKIIRIGDLQKAGLSIRRYIDARGRVVTPGFIDSHAHGDPLRTPEFQNFSAMGVTTLVLGQDGESAEDIPRWMDAVAAARPAINIATLVGHGTVRDLAGIRLNPAPTAEDIQKMVDLVAQAVEAGCFGLSTGLEYQPGSFSNQDELVAIARPLGEKGGLVHSHMRSEDDDAIEGSMAELINQGAGGACPVQISHMKVVYGKGAARAEKLLQQMAEARNSGVSITADMYPYTASYTTISIIFPDWALPPFDYAEVVKNRRDELSAFLRERVTLRNGPEATLFGTAPWAGRTLAQLAVELNKPFEDILIDDIGPGGASAAYFVMDQALQDRLFVDPFIMVSSDGSPSMRHPRAYGSFARVMRYYVRETGKLSLAEAVHKMTGLPAATLGLVGQQRGLLKPGFAADVLIFDPAKVLDMATFEEPHQLAQGFDWVLVNGVIIREEGIFSGRHGGQMLKKWVQP